MKRIVIGMGVFTLIAVLTTTLLILNQRGITKLPLGNLEGDSSGEQTKIPGITLNGTYSENSLHVDSFEVSGDQYHGNYYQISGLKNKEVESKINAMLKADSIDLVPTLVESDTVGIIFDQILYGNFSNILSVYTYISVETTEQGGQGIPVYQSFNRCTNVNLADGSAISLDDVFMDDTDILQIVSSELYEDSVWNSKWEESMETWDETVTEIDERKFQSQVKKFQEAWQKDEVQLYISPENVVIWLEDDYFLTIPLEDYVDDVAIYTRFLTEDSLYEDNTLGTEGVFNFSTLFSYGSTYHDYGEKRENLFVDAKDLIFLDEEDQSDIVKQIHAQTLTELKQEVEEQMQYAEEHPEQGFFFTMGYTVEEDKTITVRKTKHVYTMDLDYYQNQFVEILANSYRRSSEGGGIEDTVYVIYDQEVDPIQLDVEETSEYYSAKSGKKLEELKDYFTEGYAYDSLFRDVFLKNNLEAVLNREVSAEELQEEYEKTEFIYNGYDAFQIFNQTLGYEENGTSRWTQYRIPLSQLNEDYLTF